MPKSIVLVLALALLWTASAEASQDGLVQAGPEGPISHQEVVDSLLFIELSGPGNVDRTVDVSYFVDGALYFSERIEFRQPERDVDQQVEQNHPAALELLAWQPTIRQHLFEQDQAGAEVLVTISPVDRSTSELTLDDLHRQSRQLQAIGLRPAPNRSQTTFATRSQPQIATPESTTSLHPKGACEDTCNYDYNRCENDCGIDQQCIYQCEVALGWCLDDCEGCTGPTTEEWQEQQIISNVLLGLTVCHGEPGFTGVVSDYVYLKIKYTTYRRTTYCDGSSTTAVIGVSYYDRNCWYWNGFCTNPSGHYLPVCPI